MTPLEVADTFVAAINSGEVNRLVSLMTPEHMFVDADGSEHVGRDGMRWAGPAGHLCKMES
jgi:ketosteroid isomerase-like protein